MTRRHTARDRIDSEPEPRASSRRAASKCPVHIDVPATSPRSPRAASPTRSRSSSSATRSRPCAAACACARARRAAGAASSTSRSRSRSSSAPRPTSARTRLPRPSAAAARARRGRGRRPGGPDRRLRPRRSAASTSPSTRRSRTLGGMLRYGIPNYRLPDYALDKRHRPHPRRTASKVETGVRVGTRHHARRAARATHDAVVVTAGLQGSRALPIPGADLPQRADRAAVPRRRPRAARDVELGQARRGRGRRQRRDGRRAHRSAHGRRRGARRLPRERRGDARLRRRGARGAAGGREGPLLVGTARGGRRAKTACAGSTSQRCLSVFDEEKRFSPTFDEDEVAALRRRHRHLRDRAVAPTWRDLGVELTPRGGDRRRRR